MTKKDKEEARVHCRRLDRMLPVSEHRDCPYCFGVEQKIEEGRHPDFCDYNPDKDPLNFGFPPDSSRNIKG